MSTVDAKCSVILTTHSMEEAEALCTRIGVSKYYVLLLLYYCITPNSCALCVAVICVAKTAGVYILSSGAGEFKPPPSK
jgi:hypothetical protein